MITDFAVALDVFELAVAVKGAGLVLGDVAARLNLDTRFPGAPVVDVEDLGLDRDAVKASYSSGR